MKINKNFKITPFHKWLVGFTDGDGSFYIKKNDKWFSFFLGYHLVKNDIICINNIKEGLNLDQKVEIRPKSVLLGIHKHSVILNTVIPIFDNYPLITKKGNVYTIWRESFIGYINKSINREELLQIKYKLNDANYLNLLPDILNFKHISTEYIVGFLEAEGSFVLSGNRNACAFYISQHQNSIYLLEAIKQYIINEWKPINSTPKLINDYLLDNWEDIVHLTKPNKHGIVSLYITNIDFLNYVVVPYLDSVTWYSKKYQDYLDWKSVIKLYIGGYHKIYPEVLDYINHVKLNSNRKRWNSTSEYDINIINNILCQLPIYDLRCLYRANSVGYNFGGLLGVYVYDLNNKLLRVFSGTISAASHFKCTKQEISKFIKNNIPFKSLYLLSSKYK